MGEYSGKFRLYKLSDFKELPAMRWFIKPVVPRNGITLLYGEAKTGKKTFLGISKACAIATGTDWCGFSTTKGRVLYIVGEGFFGVLRRVAAWEKLHAVETGDNLRLLRVPINFFNEAEVENALAALKAQGFEPDFVVIDTLARSMSGGKENATEDMSKVFELMDYFRARLVADQIRSHWSEAGIEIIHHTGKEGIDYRGSSVIKGAVDAMIMAQSNGLEITLISKGYKDAVDFETFSVRCESVAVVTEDGIEEVLAVKQYAGTVGSPDYILNQPLNEGENHARQLVEVMVKRFTQGCTATEFRKQCETDLGFKKTTFFDAFEVVKDKGWIVGGGKRGARYNLNPDGAWKEAAEGPAQGSDLIGSVWSPLRGDGPTGPTLVGSDGPSPDQVRTNGPSAGYKNVDATASNKKPNENNKSESSTAKAESLDDVLIKEGIGATKKPAKVS